MPRIDGPLEGHTYRHPNARVRAGDGLHPNQHCSHTKSTAARAVCAHMRKGTDSRARSPRSTPRRRRRRRLRRRRRQHGRRTAAAGRGSQGAGHFHRFAAGGRPQPQRRAPRAPPARTQDPPPITRTRARARVRDPAALPPSDARASARARMNRPTRASAPAHHMPKRARGGRERGFPPCRRRSVPPRRRHADSTGRRGKIRHPASLQ